MKYVIRHDHDESLRYDETISDGLSPAAFRVAKRDFLQRGVLSKRMLERIWVPLQLSAEVFDVLVSVLEQFDIALPLSNADSEPCLLVPSFLRDVLPSTAWPHKCPDGELEGSRVIELGAFAPQGLMQRLQVPLFSIVSRYSDSFFSKDGLVVPTGGGVVLLVREDIVAISNVKQHVLSISARGKDVEKLWRNLKITIQMVTSVLRQWPGLSYDIWIPWRLSANDMVYFELRMVAARRRSGDTHITTMDAARSNVDAGSNAAEDVDIPLDSLLGPDKSSQAAAPAGSGGAPSLVRSPLQRTFSHLSGDVDDSPAVHISLRPEEASREARALQSALNERGISAYIPSAASEGDMQSLIDGCKIVIVFGSASYGSKCTRSEEWQYIETKQVPYVWVKMCEAGPPKSTHGPVAEFSWPAGNAIPLDFADTIIKIIRVPTSQDRRSSGVSGSPLNRRLLTSSSRSSSGGVEGNPYRIRRASSGRSTRGSRSSFSSTFERREDALNEPGRWDFFISYTQRNAAATAMAEKLNSDIERNG
jgi:hypothetical protein